MDRDKYILFMNIVFADGEEYKRFFGQLNDENIKDFHEFLEQSKNIQLPS